MTNSDIQVDGQVIKSTVFYPDAAGSHAPAILFIHGWKSSQDEFAVAIVSKRFVFGTQLGVH